MRRTSEARHDRPSGGASVAGSLVAVLLLSGALLLTSALMAEAGSRTRDSAERLQRLLGERLEALGAREADG